MAQGKNDYDLSDERLQKMAGDLRVFFRNAYTDEIADAITALAEQRKALLEPPTPFEVECFLAWVGEPGDKAGVKLALRRFWEARLFRILGVKPMSNTAQRTNEQIADALRPYCHCDEFNGPRPWCAVDVAIATLRKPQQVTPKYCDMCFDGPWFDAGDDGKLTRVPCPACSKPQQVTPEMIEAACDAYNEFSNGWDEGDNQTHAMRTALEAALSAQRGGSE